MPNVRARLRSRKEIRAPHPALLPRSFYLDAPDVIARKLLGKLLVRPSAAKVISGLDDPSGADDLVGRIVEVEAYFGAADPSAHAFAGKTARTEVLFGPPGHAYVYFIYGMHSCLNVSCEPEGQAGSVLIRALEPLSGLAAMAKLRWPERILQPPNALASSLRLELTSGPGRLCQAFAVTRAQDNGEDFTSPLSSLQIQDDGFLPGEVLVTPRIGISKAADKLARFLLAANPHVSKARGQRL